MTRREELDAEIARLQAERAKLDTTPWEELGEPGPSGLLPIEPTLVDGWTPSLREVDENGGELNMTELEHVAHIYNAHPQLIACVKVLREWVDAEHYDSEDLVNEAERALEELDAL